MTRSERCDTCGRFHSSEQPGASWGCHWSYDMSGTPELHEPRHRCAPCTDRIGVVGTNCVPEGYAGRNPTEREAPRPALIAPPKPVQSSMFDGDAA